MKLTNRRMQQIKRLAIQRKSKTKKRIKKKKIQQVAQPKSQILSEFNKLIHRKDMNYNCRHYLVGASSFMRFLRGQYTLEKAHGCLRSREGQRIGTIGEQAFAQKASKFLYQPFTIYNRLPFICCSADFIVFEPKLKLIEIKTSESHDICQALFDSPPPEYLIQIWLCMELFRLSTASLFIYHYTNKTPFRNKYGYPKFVKLFGKVHIRRKATLFTSGVIKLSIERYLTFIKKYFETMKVNIEENDFHELKERLLKCAETRKPLRITERNIRNSIIQRTNNDLSSTCFKLAGFDPDTSEYESTKPNLSAQERYKDVKKNLALRLIEQRQSTPLERTIDLTKELITKLTTLKED